MPRWLELELRSQPAKKPVIHLLPDSHRPIALHVAMSAHAQDARVRPSDISAQQEQVDQLADILDAVAMLRKAHRPADHRAPRRGRHLADLDDLLPRDS